MNQRKRPLNLHLFDDAPSGGTAAEAGQTTGVISPAAEGNRAIADDAVQRDGSDSLHAADGKITTEALHGEEGAEAPSFDELIKGAYKEEFNKRMTAIVQQRLSDTKEMEERMNRLNPLVQKLCEKYRLEEGDVDGLIRAVGGEDALLQEDCKERGITPEQLHQIRKLQRQNQEIKKAMEQKKAKEQAEETVSRWVKEGEEMKSIYPAFDLRQEMGNPDFGKLLKGGVPIRTAYEALHTDEILSGAMAYTAKIIAEKQARGLAAKAIRPDENGISSQSAIVSRVDVNHLSKQERADIMKRVAKGETISF